MSEIKVEKTVGYLEKEKLYSISLRTIEPYGKYHPKTIYITAIFHKNLEKALKMAWKDFYKSKLYQDNYDKLYENMSTETVSVIS